MDPYLMGLNFPKIMPTENIGLVNWAHTGMYKWAWKQEDFHGNI